MASEDADRDRPSSRRFVIGDSRHHPCFRLVVGRTSADDLTAPFVRYDAGNLPYVAYLATLEQDGVAIADPVTVLIETSEYPPAASGTAAGSATNAHADRVWEEAAARWRSDAAQGVARLVPQYREHVPPEGDLVRHPPLAYCRRTGEYVEPVCPTCLGPLATCRDEGLLRRSGLPSYAGTLSRFLTCATCAGRDQTVFYTFELRGPDAQAASATVRRRSQLYRDLGPQIKGGAAAVPETHACFRCAHRHDCYPSTETTQPCPAERYLVPVSYYDFRFLPVETLPLHADEVCALLGGAAVADGTETVTSRSLGAGAAEAERDDPARAATFEGLEDARNAFFFAGDGGMLYVGEVLYLKLRAFRDVVDGVAALHRAGQRPHLALSIDRVRGLRKAAGSRVPSRWTLGLRITDLLTTAPLPGRAPDDPIWATPHPAPYAVLPRVMAVPQTQIVRMRLRVRSLEVDGGTQTNVRAPRRVTLVGELTSEDYRDGGHGRLDAVDLVVHVPGGPDAGAAISGRKIDDAAGGFVFRGRSGELDAETAERVRQAIPSSASVEVTIRHAHQVTADVFSLGFMLLRFLFNNDDGPDPSWLDRATLTRVAAQLTRRAEQARVSQALSNAEQLAAVLEEEGIDADPRVLLYRAVDRERTDRVTLPKGLWEDVLILAIRMATHVPGWSIVGHADDVDPDDLAAPIQLVSDHLERLIDRVRSAILGSGGRNGIVLEVLEDFYADYVDAAQSGTLGGSFDSDDPEVTKVGWKRQ